MKMLDKPCHGCPFTASSLVSPARVKEIVQELAQRDCHFVCHKDIIAPRFRSQELVCRGYYEKVFLKTGVGQLMRVVDRLGGAEIVTLTKAEEAESKVTLAPHKSFARRKKSKPKSGDPDAQ